MCRWDPYGAPVTWDPTAPGVLALPSGRLIRGRGLRDAPPEGPSPQFGVYLLARRPDPVAWEAEWIRWPDFRLPTDRDAAARLLRLAWERSAADRVEVACRGGRGRTGTALACLAIIDGVPPADAVAFVREHYSPHAVETPGQHRFVSDFTAID